MVEVTVNLPDFIMILALSAVWAILLFYPGGGPHV